MSSNSERDLADYVTDEPNTEHNEDELLFLHAPEGGSDPWAKFFTGILIGLAGGALVVIAPWLGGALIMTGYCLTAYSLMGSTNRFANGLCFGFAVSAVLGAALVASEIGAQKETLHFVAKAGQRHLVFPSVALFPWTLGLLRYLLLLIWPPKRRTRARGG